MDRQDQVKDIVTQVWGVHSRFVGDEYVDRIQKAVESKEPIDAIVTTAKGGDSFDWLESVKILYEAIVFTNATLTLYFGLQKLLGRDPTREELSKKVQEAFNPAASPAVTSKAESVVQQLVK